MDAPQKEDQEPRSKANLVHQKTWADYLWIIREHWILALLAATACAAYYAHKESQGIPMYRSVAVVLFEPQRDRVINIQEVSGSNFDMRNHLTDLRSNSFRNRVVDSLSEEEEEIIGRGYGSDPNMHSIIARANKIRISGGNIFNFEFHHRDAEAAALLANRFYEEYMDFLLERQRRTNESALRFLRSQSEELKLKVERSELAVEQFRQERNLVSLEESQNLILQRMQNISGALNGAKLELLNLSARIEQVEAAQDDLDALAKLPAINQMGNLPSRFEQRSALLGQRQTLALRYGRRHPRMIENATQLDTVEAEINISIEKNVSDMRGQYQEVQNRVKVLEEALAEAEKNSLELDQIAIEYNVLRRKLATDERLFTQVHTRLNEAILASQLSNSDLRLVDRAWPAGAPFAPDTSKIYSSTAFLFLIVFCGVPFALHFLNLKLKTAADIEEKLGIPFLGEIRKFPRKLKNLHNLVLEKSHPEGLEVFRQIHSHILMKNRGATTNKTYVVTSVLPTEGKSFFATNLAASFSSHHYKTLLIDCDFRRPTIGRQLKSALGGAEHVPPGHPVTVAENLDVLPFSESSGQPTELIESTEFKKQMEAFRAEYGVIIIDTPPAGLFPDAGLIGNLADHFIFVTLLNKHRKATLQAILNRLSESKATVLGVVVNKVRKSKSRNLGVYRYMDYKKYKNYYSHPQKTAAT